MVNKPNYEFFKNLKESITQSIDSLTIKESDFECEKGKILEQVDFLSANLSHFTECSELVSKFKSKLESLSKGRSYFCSLMESLDSVINNRIERLKLVSNLKTEFNSYSQCLDIITKKYLEDKFSSLEPGYIDNKTKVKDTLCEINKNLDIMKMNDKNRDEGYKTRKMLYQKMVERDEQIKEELENLTKKYKEEIEKLNDEIRSCDNKICDYTINNYKVDNDINKLKKELKAYELGFESLDEVEEVVKDFFKNLKNGSYDQGKGKMSFKNYKLYLPDQWDHRESYFGVEHLLPLNDILVKCFNILDITYTFERIEKVITVTCKYIENENLKSEEDKIKLRDKIDYVRY